MAYGYQYIPKSDYSDSTRSPKAKAKAKARRSRLVLRILKASADIRPAVIPATKHR